MEEKLFHSGGNTIQKANPMTEAYTIHMASRMFKDTPDNHSVSTKGLTPFGIEIQKLTLMMEGQCCGVLGKAMPWDISFL